MRSSPPTSKDSNWTEQEVGFAVARGKTIVPLRFGMDPHGFVGRFQGMTIRGDQRIVDVVRKVFEALVKHADTSGRMARSLVVRFSESASFDSARQNFALLRMIPKEVWSPQLARSIRDARETNPELTNANIVKAG